MKACLHQGQTTEPPTNPNPETTTFPNNYVEFDAAAEAIQEGQSIVANITIRDTTSNYLNFYKLVTFGGETGPDLITDKFVIPVGDQFSVDVGVKYGGPQSPTPPGQPVQKPYTVNFESGSCNQVSDTMCTGTMDRSPESLEVDIRTLPIE